MERDMVFTLEGNKLMVSHFPERTYITDVLLEQVREGNGPYAVRGVHASETEFYIEAENGRALYEIGLFDPVGCTWVLVLKNAKMYGEETNAA